MNAPAALPATVADVEAVDAVASALEADHSRPAATHAYSRFCAFLSKASLVLAVIGLIGLILCVQFQVVGRYIFNDTPTWAEALALQLVLYVTALGVAVGVRDAGHIGLESLVSLLSEKWRLRVEIIIHGFVVLFGALMAQSGWLWTSIKWSDIKPMLGVPVGADYLALVVAGVLIVLFSIEHIVALIRGEEVVPAWN
jgi:TRAP-type C4-dicarboxylate transport system permease small subunit